MVDFGLQHSDFTILGLFSFLKGGDEFSFAFDGFGVVVVFHGHHGKTGGTLGFGVRDRGLFFGVRCKGFCFMKSCGGLPHNFIPNIGPESGHEKMESDVVVAILNTEFDKVDSDLGTNSDGGGDDFRQSPHDGTKGVLRDLLLVEVFEGGHVVDRISYPNIVVDDAFCLALDEGGDVDGGST